MQGNSLIDLLPSEPHIMFKRVARQVRKSEKEDPVKAAGDFAEDQDASDVFDDSSSVEEESDDDSVSSGSEDEAESSTGERTKLIVFALR